MAAIRTILIADLVMSLDNVIAVAAAAKGSMALLILGLAISIPLVIFGSTLDDQVDGALPIIVMLGAALIGWVGGETIVSDTALKGLAAPIPGSTTLRRLPVRRLVIGIGKWNSRHAQNTPETHDRQRAYAAPSLQKCYLFATNRRSV
jgi:predicted tellurium resistance membrane protein TerC